MIYIFPDTNIFIHGKHFEEIDWVTLAGEKDIALMLAPIVIDELDDHKYNVSARIAKRAKKLLPRIEEVHKNPGASKWKVVMMVKRPGRELLDEHHLDPKDHDDLLLATIIEFGAGLSGNDQAVLITNDTGPRLKAASLNVIAIQLPEEYLAALEADEMEKKLASLQNELDKIKNKIPGITLLFADGNNFLKVEKPGELITQEKYINQEMEKIRTEFQPLIYLEGNSQLLSNMMMILSQAQVNNYNTELQEFFTKSEAYFISEYKTISFAINSCEIIFQLKNSGTVPADDLDLHLHFPDGFQVLKEKDLPKSKKKPEPPYKPKNVWDIQSLQGPGILSSLMPRTQPMLDLSAMNANVGGLNIKKSNSYDVTCKVKRVKHNQSVEIDAIWLKFPDINLARGFAIDYKIHAANIPDVVTGQLHVSFVDPE